MVAAEAMLTGEESRRRAAAAAAPIRGRRRELEPVTILSGGEDSLFLKQVIVIDRVWFGLETFEYTIFDGWERLQLDILVTVDILSTNPDSDLFFKQNSSCAG